MSRVNACHMPRPAPRREAEIYESIRARIIRAHCADGRDGHRCCGKVTIDREHITLSCPLCGDERLNLEPSNA